MSEASGVAHEPTRFRLHNFTNGAATVAGRGDLDCALLEEAKAAADEAPDGWDRQQIDDMGTGERWVRTRDDGAWIALPGSFDDD